MIYVISYYQAGVCSRGTTISDSIRYITFKNKINFNLIRNILKEEIKSTLKTNPPCTNELKIYYNILRIENDVQTGSYSNNFKSLKILDWKLKNNG